MPGQAHDLRETDTLIRDLTAGHLLADRAFDADGLRNDLTDRGITPIIPPKSNRKFPAEVFTMGLLGNAALRRRVIQ